jgi:hypothetical protein
MCVCVYLSHFVFVIAKLTPLDGPLHKTHSKRDERGGEYVCVSVWVGGGGGIEQITLHPRQQTADSR